MSLKIIPLGVGDAFSRVHYSTCIAIETGEGFFLVDCPHPVLKMMHEATRSTGVRIIPERLLGVILTHLHADHSSGIESLAYYSFFALKKRLVLWTHPTVSERLWAGHLAAGMEQLVFDPTQPPTMMSFDTYIDLRSLDTDRPVDLGGLTAECKPTVHHIPTTAIRVATGTSSFGYSADTTFDQSLIDWLVQTDLAFHETGLGIHTPLHLLERLPKNTLEKLRLIHYGDDVIEKRPLIQPVLEREVFSV